MHTTFGNRQVRSECQDYGRKIYLPNKMPDAPGPDPKQEILEDRKQDEHWYSKCVSSRSSLEADSDPPEEPGHMEDPIQEDLDRPNRFLRGPPAEQGSGLSDVGTNHDKYAAEDG